MPGNLSSLMFSTPGKDRMASHQPTNASSSGIKIDKKAMKAIARRSDVPGLLYLLQWAIMLAITGIGVHFAWGTWWIIPAMLAHGTVFCVPVYSLSHETAHGTAFKSRWLNETVFFVSAFFYGEEPYHRRYAHTSHHTHTMQVGLDGQMPFDIPLTLGGWLKDVSGVFYISYYVKLHGRLALGRFSENVLAYTPQQELTKLKRGARILILGYAGIAGLVVAGYMWPLMYIIIPRLVGWPVMLLFTMVQHAEMAENDPSILNSTRSFRTNWLGRFLYMNMNYHVEHHLYPQMPWYALPKLNALIHDQLPEPDPGFWKTNWEVFLVVLRRSQGKSTRAPSIRQAPHMITDGGYSPLAKASMT